MEISTGKIRAFCTAVDSADYIKASGIYEEALEQMKSSNTIVQFAQRNAELEAEVAELKAMVEELTSSGNVETATVQ